jgi:hypothetical protein
MAYRPPPGIAPPQLAGKRTGRPRGAKSHAAIRADIEWAHRHRFDPRAVPPTPAAGFWSRLALSFPDEFGYWYERGCRVVDADDFFDGY